MSGIADLRIDELDIERILKAIVNQKDDDGKLINFSTNVLYLTQYPCNMSICIDYLIKHEQIEELFDIISDENITLDQESVRKIGEYLIKKEPARFRNIMNQVPTFYQRFLDPIIVHDLNKIIEDIFKNYENHSHPGDSASRRNRLKTTLQTIIEKY